MRTSVVLLLLGLAGCSTPYGAVEAPRPFVFIVFIILAALASYYEEVFNTDFPGILIALILLTICSYIVSSILMALWVGKPLVALFLVLAIGGPILFLALCFWAWDRWVTYEMHMRYSGPFAALIWLAIFFFGFVWIYSLRP